MACTTWAGLRHADAGAGLRVAQCGAEHLHAVRRVLEHAIHGLWR